MPIKVEPSRTIENAENVRETGSIAWIGCLGFARSPTSYIFYGALLRDSLIIQRTVLFFVLPGLLFVRAVIAAVKLGRKLADRQYLATVNISQSPYVYLFRQFLGF